MNLERFKELAALNAIGALDGADAQEFARLTREADSAALAEAGAFNSVAGMLAAAQTEPQSPPASLKDKILKRASRASRSAASSGLAAMTFRNVMSHEGQWIELAVPGVRVKNLSEDRERGYSVKLYDLAPGACFPSHPHSGDEQCFVLSGDFHVEGHILRGGDFHRAAAGSQHGESYTEGGCQLLVIAPGEDYD